MNFPIINVFNVLRRTNHTNLYKFLSFKSAVSLENIYPTSKLALYTPNQIPENGEKKFNGYIPLEHVKVTYSRSSGPGGQNVNTVSTKVDLRFHLESATWLHPTVREKLLQTHKNQLSKEGFLIIRSDKTRSQHLNLADALARLRDLLWSASAPEPPGPTPETQEMLRRRRERSNRERLFRKRMDSLTKQGRQAPTYEP